MQKAYNKKNIKLNYLNSYVKYYIEDNKLFLHNTIFNKDIVVSSDIDNIKSLIESLNKGITTDKLVILLKEFSNEPENLYKSLLQNYIIE